MILIVGSIAPSMYYAFHGQIVLQGFYVGESWSVCSFPVRLLRYDSRHNHSRPGIYLCRSRQNETWV